MRVAIIGGGFCGCVSAYQVARALKTLRDNGECDPNQAPADHEVVLFEQHDRLGGSVRSVSVQGVNVEVGLWDSFTADDLRVLELIKRCGMRVQPRRAASPAHGGLYATAVLDWPTKTDTGTLVRLSAFGGLPWLNALTSGLEDTGLAQLLPFVLAVLALRMALRYTRWLLRLGWALIGISLMWMSLSQMPYITYGHKFLMRTWQRLQHRRRFGRSAQLATQLGAGFADQWRRIYRQGVAYCWSVAQFLQAADMWSWAVTNVAQLCRDAHIRLAFAEEILEPVALREVFGTASPGQVHDRDACLLLQVNGFAGLRAMASLDLCDADEYGALEGLECLCQRLVEKSGARVMHHARVIRIHAVPADAAAFELPRWRLEFPADATPSCDVCFDAVVLACSEPPPVDSVDLAPIEKPPLGDATMPAEAATVASDAGTGHSNAAQAPAVSSAAAFARVPGTSAASGVRAVALVVGRLANSVLRQCGYHTEAQFPDLVTFKTPLCVDPQSVDTPSEDAPAHTAQRGPRLRPASASEFGLVRLERLARFDTSASPGSSKRDIQRYLYRLLFLAPEEEEEVEEVLADRITNGFVRPLFAESTCGDASSAAHECTFTCYGVYFSRLHAFRCYPVRRSADANKALATVLGARLLYPAMIKRLAPGLEMMALGARMTCTLLEDHIRWILPSPTDMPRYERIMQSPFNRIGWVE